MDHYIKLVCSPCKMPINLHPNDVVITQLPGIKSVSFRCTNCHQVQLVNTEHPAYTMTMALAKSFGCRIIEQIPKERLYKVLPPWNKKDVDKYIDGILNTEGGLELLLDAYDLKPRPRRT